MKVFSIVVGLAVVLLSISATESCSTSILDLIIILDASGSIGLNDFKLSLKAAEDIVSKLNVGPNTVRIGYFTYASDVVPLTTFISSDQDKAKLIDIIRNTVYTQGGTATGDALEFAARIFSMYPRSQAPKVVALFTDGYSNEGKDVIDEAQKLKSLGVDIFAIGITGGVNEEELEAIASIPVSKYKKLISSYTQLFAEVNAITEVACETPAFIDVREAVEVKSAAINEVRNFQVDMTKLPFRSGTYFMISVDVLEGNVLVNPSYDGKTVLKAIRTETKEVDGRMIFNYYYPIDRTKPRFYVNTKAIANGNNEFNFKIDTF